MIEDRLVSLISRVIAGEPTQEEIGELEEWTRAAEVNQKWLKQLSSEGYLENEIAIWQKIDVEAGFGRWLQEQKRRQQSKLRRISAWSAAACALVLIALGVLLENRPKAFRQEAQIANTQQIKPGRITATLILGDGHKVLLDSVGSGEFSMQGASKVVKVDQGRLAYKGGDLATAAETYNTLRTPRSGQYELELPDGTRVWLNNETSLRYQTAFKGKDRTVELNGEAYFEVASKADQPFVVKVRDEDVQVLGTKFDILNYPDEGGTRTTLLAGSVIVKTAGAIVKLKPNEQAQVNEDGSLYVSKEVAGEDIVSWKDGFFYFGRSSLEEVLRQLARWYDIDVVYEGKVPELDFMGKIDRGLPLNDLLKYLDKNQIHFRLEGRTLIVLPN